MEGIYFVFYVDSKEICFCRKKNIYVIYLKFFFYYWYYRLFKLILIFEVFLSISIFVNLVVIVGFDYVIKELDYIVVSVWLVIGVNSVLVNYLNVNMYEIEFFVDDMVEYEILVEVDYSLIYFLFLDGFNDFIRFLDCYKIVDLKFNKFRYFRFDLIFLECMEEVSSYYIECIVVESGFGYWVRFENNRNIDSRYFEEKWCFLVG